MNPLGDNSGSAIPSRSRIAYIVLIRFEDLVKCMTVLIVADTSPAIISRPNDGQEHMPAAGLWSLDSIPDLDLSAFLAADTPDNIHPFRAYCSE